MKTIAKTFTVAILVAAVATFTSCKDKEYKEDKEDKEITTETETTIVNNDTISIVDDPAQAAPVNDTNVSGVTGGKMEQVP